MDTSRPAASPSAPDEDLVTAGVPDEVIQQLSALPAELTEVEPVRSRVMAALQRAEMTRRVTGFRGQHRASDSAGPMLQRGTFSDRTLRQWMVRAAVRGGAVVASLVAVFSVWRMQSSVHAERMRIFTTRAAQYAKVPLGNGIRATLGPRTRIITMVTPQRLTVTVDGVAYFQVARHTASSTSPVIVRTRSAVVRVLGTTFSVRQYADESRSQIEVSEGRIGVMQSILAANVSNQAILSAGMRAQVADSGIQVISGSTPTVSVSWTDGRLIFDGVPLGDVADELARVYGVPIRVADSALAHRSLVIEVSVKEQPLPRVLNFIGVVANAHYQWEEQGFVLIPGHLAERIPQTAPVRRPLFEPQPEKQYGR